MHIRRTDSNKGRPAIKDGLAIPILTLAQGFSKQLDIPFPERLKPHRIRHEDFDGSTMIPGGQIFHGRSKKGRIAPPVTAAANFVHIGSTGKQLRKIHSKSCSDNKSRSRKNAEPPADSIRNGEHFPVIGL